MKLAACEAYVFHNNAITLSRFQIHHSNTVHNQLETQLSLT